MSKQLNIAVAGAGIGGLIAALALIRKGYDVTVYEQAPELRELGAGLQISANGTRILIALGLRQAAEKIACVPEGKEVRLYSTGQTWKLLDLGDAAVKEFGAPYWMVHRGDLHTLLINAVEAARPGAIKLGHKLTDLEQDGSGVRIGFENGARATADVLVGADGVHSRVRQLLFGDLPAQFMGVAAWRGLVPMERLPVHLRRLVGSNWVGPGGHVITYPVRGGSILNFVAAIERDNWAVDSWTERGTIEECAADFVGWHDDIQAMVRNLEVPYKWALLGREPLQQWAVGRVTLLGDASHPTLPMLAQGANMAIEDGMVLARCIEADADPVAALKRFEVARVARTSTIVHRSTEAAKRFHNPELGNAEGAAAYVDREWTSEKIDQRYRWLFEYDALTVPV
ncbi:MULTISPECIES: FAD-dependent monooxygenase [unclassified Beijerinckia]|uniref:FAD-dependent monooxygenase n=1 Tax=unclassified Beijerinckia TaxID=2638183 RepID=UPI00089C8AAE|nr:MULTISPECIES: FAD-dependent monooxygenase [unclassified Beijerinckia]MDH7798374.1 salicylate hydroxylase [Beijerinckia sp. GAS462]SED18787.1 salicylate hydroxylase [Beijerinckia sp. 28-YEA-48]